MLDVLRAHGLPEELLGMCTEAPEEFLEWQRAWDQGDFDHSIPVMTHAATDRVIIGLADQISLAHFLLGERSSPAMLIIQDDHLTSDEMLQLGVQARSRSVPWLVASREPDPDLEISVLSAGAAEVLPVQEDSRLAQARLVRILRDLSLIHI